jgi:Ribbon-helix-helix protein, copG family
MRLSVRVSEEMAQQLSTISASRGTGLSSVVREAVASYLAAPEIDIRKPPPFGQKARLRHTLDECVATILCHWPQEMQERLTAEMVRTGLSRKSLLLGILYDWATHSYWLAFLTPPYLRLCKPLVWMTQVTTDMYPRRFRSPLYPRLGACPEDHGPALFHVCAVSE